MLPPLEHQEDVHVNEREEDTSPEARWICETKNEPVNEYVWKLKDRVEVQEEFPDDAFFLRLEVKQSHEGSPRFCDLYLSDNFLLITKRGVILHC